MSSTCKLWSLESSRNSVLRIASKRRARADTITFLPLPMTSKSLSQLPVDVLLYIIAFFAVRDGIAFAMVRKSLAVYVMIQSSLTAN